MPTIVDLFTIAIAFSALVLGVFNTVWNMTHDRVRLHVSANGAVTFDMGTMRRTLMLNVTNLGTTAITLDSIQIPLPDNRAIQFPGILTTSGKSFPVRMEPRTAVSILLPQKIFNEGTIEHGTNVIANTACGRVFRGGNPRRFRKLVRMIHASADEGRGRNLDPKPAR